MPASSLFILGINFVLLSLSHASGKGYCGIIVVMPQPADYARPELPRRVDGL